MQEQSILNETDKEKVSEWYDNIQRAVGFILSKYQPSRRSDKVFFDELLSDVYFSVLTHQDNYVLNDKYVVFNTFCFEAETRLWRKLFKQSKVMRGKTEYIDELNMCKNKDYFEVNELLKFCDEQEQEILKMYLEGLDQKTIASNFNLSASKTRHIIQLLFRRFRVCFGIVDIDKEISRLEKEKGTKKPLQILKDIKSKTSPNCFLKVL